jgi:transcriptional regulator with XRE-family HTH domain
MLDRLSASLAENLRRLREARGLTQQELSEASGVPRPTLAHLESGSANPTLSVLARVAVTLAVPMEELVAAPSAALAFHAAASLVEHEHDNSRLRELCPDGPGGVVVERIELPVRGRLERALGRQADRTYLTCERGEIEVASGAERHALRSGDVVIVRRGAAHLFVNRGRSAAVVYSVRTGAWTG